MLLYLILASFVSSTLVASGGWETRALMELGRIMRDAVSLSEGWSSFTRDSYIREAGILSSGDVSRFNMYQELFALTLKPNFPVYAVDHATTLIRVAKEAVDQAGGECGLLFDTVIKLPSSNVEAFTQTRDTFSTQWSKLGEDMTQLIASYEIPLESPIPRLASGEVDFNTTKFVVELAELSASRRQLVGETLVCIQRFHAWLTTQQTFKSDFLSNLGSLLFVSSKFFEVYQVAKPHEKLELMVQYASDFEGYSRFLVNKVTAVAERVQVVTSLHPEMAEFYSLLKGEFAKKWKAILVRSSVIRSRISTEVDRRRALVSNVVDPLCPLSIMRYELLDVIESVITLHEECSKFISDAYARGGLFGQEKLQGLSRFRGIFFGFREHKSTHIESQKLLIGVSHEAVGDVTGYIETLISELNQLGLLTHSPSAIEHWVPLYRALHNELTQLRVKHEVPMVRYSPQPQGLYVSDPELVGFLKRVIESFSRIRNLLTESHNHVEKFQQWIGKNRRFFVTKVSSRGGAQLEANISTVIHDFKKVEAIIIDEGLEPLIGNMRQLEGLTRRFAGHISQLVEGMSSLPVRGESNQISEFLSLLRNDQAPKWAQLMRDNSNLSREILTVVIRRQGGDDAQGGSAVSSEDIAIPENRVVSQDIEDPDQIIAELLRLEAEGLENHPTVMKAKPRANERFRRLVKPSDSPAKETDQVSFTSEEDEEELFIDEIPCAQGGCGQESGFKQVFSRKERRALAKLERKDIDQSRVATDIERDSELVSVVPRIEHRAEVDSLPEVQVTQIETSHELVQVSTATSEPSNEHDESVSSSSRPDAGLTRRQRKQMRRQQHAHASTESFTAPISAPGLTNQMEGGRNIFFTFTTANQTKPQTKNVSRKFDLRKPIDPRMDMCMHRLLQLTHLSYQAYAEMYHLCDSMRPQLWASGNIEGAKTIEIVQSLAHHSFANAMFSEPYIKGAWQTQFLTRP